MRIGKYMNKDMVYICGHPVIAYSCHCMYSRINEWKVTTNKTYQDNIKNKQ